MRYLDDTMSYRRTRRAALLTQAAVAATVLLLVAWATPARAQLREVPLEHTNGPTFVEVVESGAAGDYQLIGLRWHSDFNAPDDLLIYDRANGQALLVVAVGVPLPGLWATSFPLVECLTWVTLRPGLRLEAIDLDRDGRRDLIGHNALTGEVVRLYRRGRGCS